MYGIILVATATLFFVSYFILKPVVDYFRDPKGFRKYPSINAIAGISNIGFMWEAQKGFRSKKLLEVHKKHPVIRIGPNSLSYGSSQAIKVRYNDPCI
jgi:hypothetical protein